MIRVEAVHKSFGSIYAVRGVSFELQPGQVVGLLGPNGAGKTTTIRMITGYLPPDAGRVSVGGFDTLTQSLDARRLLGYLPESAPLYPEMKTEDYLDYRGRLFSLPRAHRRQAIDRVVERCWLKNVRSRRVGTLSKGYKQRVGLAAALLHEPKVLVLDEPTNGLDPTQIKETRQLIRELATQRTLLVSSHILSEVERLCDRVVIVSEGRVRGDGSPQSLVSSARQVSTYVVQCRRQKPGDDEKAFRIWSNLPFVADIQPDTGDRSGLTTGWSLWLLTAKPGAPDLRESIATAAHEAGIIVRELRLEVPSLEKVFLKLIDAADAPAAAPPVAPPTPPAKGAA
jgi:ABC-2 type transport system ATP-binding protein